MKRIIEGFNLELATTRAVFGPRALAYFFALNLLFSFVIDGSKEPSRILVLLVSRILVSSLNVVLAWTISSHFYRVSRSAKAGLVFNLILMEFLGLIGTSLYTAISLPLVSNQVAGYGVRILFTVLSAPFVFLSGIYVLDKPFRQEKLVAQASELQEQVNYLKENLKNIVEEDRRILLQRVQMALGPKITYAREMIQETFKASEAVAVLRFLNQLDVRPLSNEIAQFEMQDLAKDTSPAAKVSSREYRYLLSKTLNPGSFLSLSLITYFFMVVSARFGLDIQVIWNLVAITIFMEAIRRLSVFLKPAKLSLTLGFLLLVLAADLGLVYLSWNLSNFNSSTFSKSALLSLVIDLFLISSSISITSQRSDYLLAKLDDLSNERMLELSKLRQLQWISRRQVVSQVHGEVQGAVVAALTRLAGADDEQQMEKAKDDLDRAFLALQSPKLFQVDLSKALTELRDAWSGVCAISFDLPMQIETQLSSSDTAGAVANALINEGVVNAVRHGKATRVKIVFKTVNQKLICIEVIDDGQFEPSHVPGNGSALISELTTNWSLRRVKETTVLQMFISTAGDFSI